MAIIIGADSSTQASGVGLFDTESKKLALRINDQERMRAEELLSLLDNLLVENSFKKTLPDAFAVALGPGSFTGLRIGISMLKTMAQFSNKPILGISSLEALAYSCLYMKGEYDTKVDGSGEKPSEEAKSDFPSPGPGDLVISIVDARANRIFASAYICKSLNPAKTEKAQAAYSDRELIQIFDEGMYFEEVLIEEVSDLLGKIKENQVDSADNIRIFWAGRGIEAHKNLLEGIKGEHIIPDNLDMASPIGAICLLAAKRYENKDFDSYLDLKPNYLRKSQAELELDRKAGKK